jgi:hypothetical protein
MVGAGLLGRCTVWLELDGDDARGARVKGGVERFLALMGL